MTTPYSIPLTPTWEGTTGPVALETHRTRKSDSSSHVPLTRNVLPTSEAGAGVPSLPTQELPHTVSISKGNWCYMLVLLLRGGEGGGKGIPGGEPPFPEAPLLRWCTPLLGSPTSPCPPGAIPGCIPLVPKYRKP